MLQLAQALALALVPQVPSWAPLGGPVPVAGRTMTPRIEVLAGRVAITFRERDLGLRGSVRLYDEQFDRWAPVGLPGSCSTREDWWSRIAYRNNLLVRASYEYGLHPDGGSGLNLRRFDPVADAWVRLGPLPLSTGQAHTPDVVVTQEGKVLVAYQDGPGGNAPGLPEGAVSVQEIDPVTGTAQYLGPQGFSDLLVGSPRSKSWHVSLEVAPDRTPWVAWSETSASDLLFAKDFAAVARYQTDQLAWELVGGFGLGHGARGDHIALALGPAGEVFVATYVPLTGTGAVRVFRFEESTGTWSQVGPEFGELDGVDFSPEAGYREYLALAVDPSGVPHVAYRAASLSARAVVRRYDALLDDWIPVGGGPFSPMNGADDYLSLAFLGSSPVVAFRHGCSDTSVCLASELQVWIYR